MSQVLRHAEVSELATGLASSKVPLLIDVRSPGEFNGGHIPQALNIPVGEIGKRLAEFPSDTEIWLICRTGSRSSLACKTLVNAGRRVVNVRGGMMAWSGPLDPPASPRRLFMPFVASLTLGLAPFQPEPHLLGKLRWLVGGAEGMGAMDWFDLWLHGAPWLWLIWTIIGMARDAWRARQS